MDKYSKMAARLQNRGYNSANGNGATPIAAQRLTSFNSTVTVVITNTSNVDSTYTVFGFNALGTDPTQGAGVTVTASPTSYAEVTRALANSPSKIGYMRYKTNDTDNFENVITYTTRNPLGGRTVTDTITPGNYLAPNNQQNTIVDIAPIDIILSGDTKFTGTIEGDSTITWYFQVGSMVTLADANLNAGVVQERTTQYATGVAPVQLQAAPAPSAVGVGMASDANLLA